MTVKEIINGTKEVTKTDLLAAEDWEDIVNSAKDKFEEFIKDFQIFSLRLTYEDDELFAYWTSKLFNNLDSFELALYFTIFLENFGY